MTLIINLELLKDSILLKKFENVDFKRLLFGDVYNVTLIKEESLNLRNNFILILKVLKAI